MSHIDIVFTAPPGPGNECVFVEAEDAAGKSIRIGEWVTRQDGSTALRIPDLRAELAAEKAKSAADPARIAAWDASDVGKAAYVAAEAACEAACEAYCEAYCVARDAYFAKAPDPVHANLPAIPEGCSLCVKGCTGACES